MVPLLQINVTFLLFTEMGMGTAVCGDGWGRGTILKLVVGIGVGMGIKSSGGGRGWV